MKIKVWLLAILSLCYLPCSMAGVVAEGTRIVYNEGLKEYGLKVANTNAYPILFQPWVDYGEGDPNQNLGPFVIVPPFSKMAPNEMNTLRMIYDGTVLPTDRETVFWLNLYEIPLLKKKDIENQYLNMAMNTQIKVFYRPKNLEKISLENIINSTKFKVFSEENESFILVENSSPYHISFLDLKLINSKEDVLSEVYPDMDMMVRPFSNKKLKLKNNMTDLSKDTLVNIKVIDDLGGFYDFKKIIIN